MYKVFYNNALIIIDKQPHPNRLFIRNKSDLDNFLHYFLSQPAPNDALICADDTNILWNTFKQCFRYVEAAGGLVKHTDQRFLFIRRFGIWDLPKGKLKIIESPATGAIREVVEETGVNDLKLVSGLPSSYHIYHNKNTWILKRTFWYSMKTSSEGRLIPQAKEDITEARWLSLEPARQALKSSYRSLAETLLPFLA